MNKQARGFNKAQHMNQTLKCLQKVKFYIK